MIERRFPDDSLVDPSPDEETDTGPASPERAFRPLRPPGESPLLSWQEAMPGIRSILLRRRWMALGLLLGLALGGAVALLRPPLHASPAYLSVSSPSSQDALAAARMAQAFARVTTAQSVVAEPLRAAGLEDAADNPRASINAQAAPDAPLFSVTGLSRDADSAQRIASTVCAAVTRLSLVGDFRAVVVSAAPPATLTTPRWMTPVGLGLTGFGLACVLAATVPHRPVSGVGEVT